MYDKAKITFSQTTNGEHRIMDGKGNEIRVDTHALTMDDIRELLSGFGYIMQSIASSTWNKELTEKECHDTNSH